MDDIVQSFEFVDIWTAICGVLDTPTLVSFALTCSDARILAPLNQDSFQLFDEVCYNPPSRKISLVNLLRDLSFIVPSQRTSSNTLKEIRRRIKDTELDLECAHYGYLNLLTEVASTLQNRTKEMARFHPSSVFRQPTTSPNVDHFLLSVKKNAKFPPYRRWGMTILAASRGHLEILDWLNRAGNDITWSPEASYVAAWTGNIKVLTWLTKISVTKYYPAVGRGAARAGNEEIIEWMMHRQLLRDRGQLCASAALGGKLETLKWLLANGYNAGKETCHMAAQGGHSDVLQLLRDRGCPWDSNTCASAALNGHLDILIWARQQGCEWDHSTICNAAAGGYLDMMEWAFTHGCPLSPDTCCFAARGGHLDALIWAKEHGCALSTEVSVNAAQGGQLNVVKYLHQNGCPWNGQTLIAASKSGNFEIFKWAVKEGCPLSAVCKQITLDNKTRKWLLAQEEFQRLNLPFY